MRVTLLLLLLSCLSSPVWAERRHPALPPEARQALLTFLRALFPELAPLAAPQAPVTYYVAPTGSNSHTCAQAESVGTPKQTFAGSTGAWTCLAPGRGDTVYLRGGTYAEQWYYGSMEVPGGTSWATATTLASYPGEWATIRAPSGSAVLDLGTNYLIYDRLRADAAHVRYALSNIHGHHQRFQRGELFGCGGGVAISTPPQPSEDGSPCVQFGNAYNELLTSDIHGSQISHCIYAGGDYGLIEGNTIHDCGGFGVQIFDGGFPATSANHIIVRGNRIYNNGAFRGYGGVTVGSGTGNQIVNNLIYENYGGIWVYKAGTNTQVWHNTLSNNPNWGIQVYFEATTAWVQNNIISGSGANADASGDTTYSANLCSAAGVGCTLVGTPRFVDAAQHDFHLQASSPAIDTGTAVAAVTTDVDGAPRPQGAGVDIGAYEYGSAAPQPEPPTGTHPTLACTGELAARGRVTMQCVPR